MSGSRRPAQGGEKSRAAAPRATGQSPGADLPARAELPADGVVVGRVEGAYGVRGAIRVDTFNDPHDSVLCHAKRWHLAEPVSPPVVAGPRRVRPFALPASLQVDDCRVHGEGLVATLCGIASRDAAEALRGCELVVSRQEFPPPEEGEYYWVDLIGCEVLTPAGLPLGTVESVDDHGAHPLLRLRGEDGRERIIPFVEAHVPEVDLASRRIVADWDPDF